MSNELKINTSGTLTKDPELTYTPQGKAVTRFSIAINSSYRDGDSNWQNRETVFLDCVVWNEQAKHLVESCTAGDPVIVLGRG